MKGEFLIRFLKLRQAFRTSLILLLCLQLLVGTFTHVISAVNQSGSILTVNDPADPGGATCLISACSLRAAISAANASGVPGGTTIVFDLPNPAQIDLASSLPEVSSEIQVIGPGRDALSIDGGGLVRIFAIHAGANLTLSGMTLQNGWNGMEGGGAVRNGGTLELANVTLLNNLAGGGNGGGLLNDTGGVVHLTSVDFIDNDGFHDGAIANSGSVSINGSVFSGNRGRVGGAIENYPGSSMTITASAFTDNVAKISSGGAIANAGILVIANSTFYQNGSPNGADIVSGNKLYVTNSTFYGAILPSYNSISAGGAGSTVILHNNIFAAGVGVNNCAFSAGGTLVVDSSNLSSDGTCASATVTTLAALHLAPLDEVSGVPGLALLAGSAGINAGNDGFCAAAVGSPSFGAGGLDQRGIHRPVGIHCDVGAIEFLPPVLFLPMVMR